MCPGRDCVFVEAISIHRVVIRPLRTWWATRAAQWRRQGMVMWCAETEVFVPQIWGWVGVERRASKGRARKGCGQKGKGQGHGDKGK